MMYYDQFNTGKRIQKLRRERYLTQEELAVRLNVSDRHLRSLESGEYIPSIDLFIEIAAYFDVTLDHLIMGKSLSDQEESLRNKLQQKRLTNQKLRLKLQRIMQKLSAIAEELYIKLRPSGQAALHCLFRGAFFCFCAQKNFFEKFRFYRIFRKSETSSQRCFHVKTGSMTSGFSSKKTGGTTS